MDSVDIIKKQNGNCYKPIKIFCEQCPLEDIDCGTDTETLALLRYMEHNNGKLYK